MPENAYTRNHRGEGVPSQTILDCHINVFALQLLIESYTDLPEPKPLSFSYRGVDISLSLCAAAESDKPTQPTPKELSPEQLDRLFENFRHVGTWNQYEILELLMQRVDLAEVTIPWLDQFREDLDLKV